MSEILIYGSTGFLGSKICDILNKTNIEFIRGKSRLENTRDIENELDETNPRFVLNLAGLTGRPNIDWCEDNKLETVRINVIGTLGLIEACYKRNIHITNYTTGCIYNNEIGNHISFTEEDEPNWTTSYYSKTKVMLEALSKEYDNVLNLRIRMPVDNDLSNPRNLITKLVKYDKVINIPNSITILDEMLPLSIDMIFKGLTGIYNFTNPGSITHNEILDLYKTYIDNTIEIKNFTIEEQNKILKTGRCNCILSTEKIENLYDFTDVKDSITRIIKKNVN